jgi:hypothetical protein
VSHGALDRRPDHRRRRARRRLTPSAGAEWVSAGLLIGARTHMPGASSGSPLAPRIPDPEEADMPSGLFPVPKFHPVPGPRVGRYPGRALRIRTRLERNRLDGELARGVDPALSAELALRATQLRSRSGRSRTANALVQTLGNALGNEPVILRPRPQREQVSASADDLLTLVRRLRDDEPISVRGAAMAALLVSGRGSTLNLDGKADLGHALRAATVALDAAGQVPELATAA